MPQTDRNIIKQGNEIMDMGYGEVVRLQEGDKQASLLYVYMGPGYSLKALVQR